MKLTYEFSKTEAFALYGACLSTIVFIWNMLRQMRDRPIIKISVNYSISMPDSEGYICIKSVNIGKRQTTIVACAFELPDKRTIVEIILLPIQRQHLPMRLEENDFYEQYYRLEGIKRLSDKPLKVKPFVTDASGRRHYGKSTYIPFKN